MASIYEPILSDITAFQNRIYLIPELWEKFKFDDLSNVDFSKWKKIKLMDGGGNFLDDELKKIPTAYGGIYIYCIQSNIVNNFDSYVMYVGMASKTTTQNLRRRVSSYKSEIGSCYTRDRIHNLFVRWGKYVYVYYLPVDSDNETIEQLETRLIGCLIPPCNAEIQDASVKRKVKAFAEF